MRKYDSSRIKFHSKEDLASGGHLLKAEPILRNEKTFDTNDINDILELYNIKLYIENGLYLKAWSQQEIEEFKQRGAEYGKIIGYFMSQLKGENFLPNYNKIVKNYLTSFWEIVNNQKLYKEIPKEIFSSIISNEPQIIDLILTHKSIVDYYSVSINEFLMAYEKSAEIILSIYEQKENFNKKKKFLPANLNIQDKEAIISNYLDSDNINLNFVGLVENAQNKSDFRLSAKVKLKAKRVYSKKTQDLLSKNGGIRYAVEISFPEYLDKIKDGFVDEQMTAHYSYSYSFIRENNTPYSLFKNFYFLFEYTDHQNRINLIAKKNDLGIFEKISGIKARNEYQIGAVFSLSEMTSSAQIVGYSKILNDLGTSLEEIAYTIFTSSFKEKYDFAENARFHIPTAISYFEKVRLLAPEFESCLKQFKLFVEDGEIDFDLLQISSTSISIGDIPSLNKKKHLYINKDNQESITILRLFFSDQTLLSYVAPFQEKNYPTFFDLLAQEEEVLYANYQEHQMDGLDFLIRKNYIWVDKYGFIQLTNPKRVSILKDLFEFEVGSFYHYSSDFQKEALGLASENIIYFEDTLFSRPEQAYFNYYLNKSEFTNGLDLRNSYLHGTQAPYDETDRHETAYFSYFKLIILMLLKIDDDLMIAAQLRNE